MNLYRSFCFLPLLAAAQHASAAAATLPAAGVAGSAPITVALPSAYAALIWAPLLLVFVVCAGALFFLIRRQGRKPVAVAQRHAATRRAKARLATRVPSLARP